MTQRNESTLEIYQFDFECSTANAIIRTPGAKVCAEILQLDCNQYNVVREHWLANDRQIQPWLIDRVSNLERSAE